MNQIRDTENNYSTKNISEKSRLNIERKALAPIDHSNNVKPKKNVPIKKIIQTRNSLKPLTVKQEIIKTKAVRQKAVLQDKDGKGQGFEIFCEESQSSLPSRKHNQEAKVIDSQLCELPENGTCSNTDLKLGLNTLKIQETKPSKTESISIEESIISMIIDEDIKLETASKTDTEEEDEEDISLLSPHIDDILLKTCAEYFDEINVYLLDRELKFRPNPIYMTKQPDINSKMRSILVDWLVEVSDEYNMHFETLFLAASCIDRFLSVMSITRHNFQLLGASSLFIVSKYEEIYPPDIHEFVYITDDTYNKQQILGMEKLILKVLKFDISSPTIYYFLKKFSTQMKLPKIAYQMAEYLSFLCLLEDQPFLRFFPSIIAISCIILAIETLKLKDKFERGALNRFLNFKTGNIDEIIMVLRICITAIYDIQSMASQHPQQSVFQKFSCDKFSCVAQLKVRKVSKIDFYVM